MLHHNVPGGWHDCMATCMPQHTPGGGGDCSSDSEMSARAGSSMQTASGTSYYLDEGQQQEQVLHLITCCRAVG